MHELDLSRRDNAFRRSALMSRAVLALLIPGVSWPSPHRSTTRKETLAAGAREEVAMMRSPHPLNAPTFTLLAGTTSGFDSDLSPPQGRGHDDEARNVHTPPRHDSVGWALKGATT